MRENKMAKVAQMLGVELGEEFKEKGRNVLYRLTATGFEFYDDTAGKWRSDASLLVCFLMGEMEIARRPWKPKLGVAYYYPIINEGHRDRAVYTQWDSDDVDKKRYENGMVFKTVKEAEEMAEKIASFVRRERGLE